MIEQRKRAILATAERIGATDLEVHSMMASVLSLAVRGKYRSYARRHNLANGKPFLTSEMLRNARRRWDQKLKRQRALEKGRSVPVPENRIQDAADHLGVAQLMQEEPSE